MKGDPLLADKRAEQRAEALTPRRVGGRMSGVFIRRGTKQRARRNVSLGRACICHPSALRPARSHYSGAEAVGVKALIKQVHTSFATTRVARLAGHALSHKECLPVAHMMTPSLPLSRRSLVPLSFCRRQGIENAR